MKGDVGQNNFPDLLHMKENIRQDWKGVLVKFSITKQEQTRKEDAVPFVKKEYCVQCNKQEDFIFIHQLLNLKNELD